MLLLFSLLLFLGFLVWLGPFPDRSSRDGNADAGIVCGLGNCETSAVLSLLQCLLSTPLVRYTRADTKDITHRLWAKSKPTTMRTNLAINKSVVMTKVMAPKTVRPGFATYNGSPCQSEYVLGNMRSNNGKKKVNLIIATTHSHTHTHVSIFKERIHLSMHR